MDPTPSLQNIPATPPITPISPPTPPKNPNFLLPILSLVLLVSLAFSALLYYKNTQIQKRLDDFMTSNQPPPTPTSQPETETDETADWKTYTNEEYEFEFKYPNNLFLKENENNYFVLLSDKNNPQSIFLSVDARLSNNYSNYDKAIESIKSNLTDIKTQEINNGIIISGKIGPGYGQGMQFKTVLFKYKNAAIGIETTISDSNQLTIFDQILSTFKFLN